jgi:maltooligosyltrehalose synthase
VPLPTAGSRRDCLFAFARRHDEGVALTCVPRLVAKLTSDAAAPPIGRGVWGDTRIELPPHLPHGPFRDAVTGATIDTEQDGPVITIPAGAVFDHLPVALLVAG